jgi:hypothetical protein
MTPLQRRLDKLEQGDGTGMGFPWHRPCTEWPESEVERLYIEFERNPHNFTDAHLQHIIDTCGVSKDELEGEDP